MPPIPVPLPLPLQAGLSALRPDDLLALHFSRARGKSSQAVRRRRSSACGSRRTSGSRSTAWTARRWAKVETGLVTGSKGAVDVPDMRVTFAEASIATWAAWHQEFVVDGKNDAAHEKAGTLTLLAANGKDQLGAVTFSGLGIYRLSPASGDDKTAAQVARVVADLYCQRMQLAV
jgi:hypothetical protein